MTATATEKRNFAWHCAVAALLMDLPANPATSAHFRNAITKATKTVFGRKGVRYASEAAIKVADGNDLAKCRLELEHVIPATLVCKQVMADLSSSKAVVRPDLDALLIAGDLQQIREHPRVRQIAEIVATKTLLAWVTKEEHGKLKTAGLQKSMPPGWDGLDHFARYRHCGIQVIEI